MIIDDEAANVTAIEEVIEASVEHYRYAIRRMMTTGEALHAFDLAELNGEMMSLVLAIMPKANIDRGLSAIGMTFEKVQIEEPS